MKSACEKRIAKAEELFNAGYNCAQAVAGAFADILPVGEKEVLALASGFGGGLGKMREVCGTVSGMTLVVGLLHGSYPPEDKEAKEKHYGLVQELANEFKKENGSIICRELLSNGAKKPINVPENPLHAPICYGLVRDAVRILFEKLADRN